MNRLRPNCTCPSQLAWDAQRSPLAGAQLGMLRWTRATHVVVTVSRLSVALRRVDGLVGMIDVGHGRDRVVLREHGCGFDHPGDELVEVRLDACGVGVGRESLEPFVRSGHGIGSTHREALSAVDAGESRARHP